MKSTAEWSRWYPALTAPGRWAFVSSVLPIESRPVRDADYSRWAATHLHHHPHQEILFCLEGETLEHFAGRTYRCRPGSVFLIGPHEVHANGYPRGSGAFTHIWIANLGGGWLASVYAQRPGRLLEQRHAPVLLPQPQCEYLAHCWEAARQPASWQSPRVLRAALFSAVFSIVFRVLDDWAAPPAADRALQRRRELVLAVRRHIGEHLKDGCNLDSLAHVSGYSKFHFARLFKECSGQTVHDFMDDCRIRRVGEMARLGSLRKEMAAALGFSCPAAFSNWLRRNRARVKL